MIETGFLNSCSSVYVHDVVAGDHRLGHLPGLARRLGIAPDHLPARRIRLLVDLAGTMTFPPVTFPVWKANRARGSRSGSRRAGSRAREARQSRRPRSAG